MQRLALSFDAASRPTSRQQSREDMKGESDARFGLDHVVAVRLVAPIEFAKNVDPLRERVLDGWRNVHARPTRRPRWHCDRFLGLGLDLPGQAPGLQPIDRESAPQLAGRLRRYPGRADEASEQAPHDPHPRLPTTR